MFHLLVKLCTVELVAHVISRDFAAPWLNPLVLNILSRAVYKLYWPSCHKFSLYVQTARLSMRLSFIFYVQDKHIQVYVLTFCAIYLEKFSCICHELVHTQQKISRSPISHLKIGHRNDWEKVHERSADHNRIADTDQNSSNKKFYLLL